MTENINRKRKGSTELNNKNKKQKNTECDDIWKQMISASSVRNYMLDDPIIDFLKEYNINSLSDKPSKVPNSRKVLNYSSSSSSSNPSNKDSFTQHILDSGIEFEDELIKIIQKTHKIVKVSDHIHCKSKEKFDETINLMKKGTPIIYQGVLHNFENKTFGLPDLLVRSDYINKLFKYNVISDNEAKIPSPKLNVPYHYKVIDIKHSQISLRADGIHILNSDCIPAYKGQLYIYTVALNNILGININKAYIWGKKYIYESKNIKYEITDFFTKLGVIDYDGIDKSYVEETLNAINWITELRTDGMNWHLLPYPSRKELYPNMKNDKDGFYHHIKHELSQKIGEITNVWNCGYKRREVAHSRNIYSWTSPMCTSDSMGFTKGKTASVIDSILNINRQEIDIIRPNKVYFDRKKWKKTPSDTVNFYIDFETLNSNFGSIIKDGLVSSTSNPYIFMIGVGYEDNKKWVFKSFVMKQKSQIAECNMFNEFYEYIDTILTNKKKSKAKFYHWSNAEVSSYNDFKYRNNGGIYNDSNFSFYDLNQVFISEPIIIKGALNFSLKTVAKALHKHKLINSNWDSTSPCSNGLKAMLMANKIYDNIEKNNNIVNEEDIDEDIEDDEDSVDSIDIEYDEDEDEDDEDDEDSVDIEESFDIINEPIMKEIIHYNEIDCKVMWEIHNLMKNKL
jgi:predicted RecB family nuclease